MFINKTDKKQSGFSLIELLAVVGVGGALVAGALKLVSDVQTKSDIKTHSEIISTIFTNMDTIFSSESIDGVSNENFIVAGIYPSSLNISDDEVKNKDGGIVLISANGDDGFKLDYPKIKAGACVKVIQNQQRVGWDTWDVSESNGNNKDGSADADSGSDFESTTFSTIASACKTDEDWVDLSFQVE